jgi:hypothetical protein
MNSILYAIMKARKKVCEQRPDIYTWIPDDVVGFACPAGLDCVSGTCVFNEAGCRGESVPDVFDCKRRTMPCEIATRKGECSVCEYETHNELHSQYVGLLPTIDPPCDPKDTSCTNCGPGDPYYYYFTNPEKDKSKEQDPVLAQTRCKRKFDPPAYTIDGKKVPCKSDDDCAYDGAGGACMLYDQDRQASGYCVDTKSGYLEYRKNFVQDSSGQARGQCVQALNQLKTWCEMPWTRPTDKPDDAGKEAALKLEDRILLHPETRMHPPFYYDDYSGQCYVTKPYCKNSIEKGGYESSFGNAHDYVLFNNCTYPHGHKNSIREGYDCCTPLSQSVGEFFLGGKTMLSELRDLASGRMSINEFFETNAKAYALMNFLSDRALKQDVELVQTDYVAPGVHAYTFAWTPEARRLYPELTTTSTPDGKRLGLMADDIAGLYPWAVQLDANGYCKILYHDGAYSTDPVYKRIINALYLFNGQARGWQ